MTAPISPAQLLSRELIESLSPNARAMLPFMPELWLRPEQRIPQHDWRSCGFICGRGWGKTFAIAHELTRLVMSGAARRVSLTAPNDERTDEVQVSTLIAVSPPWFRPERYRDNLRWPNGVEAMLFTSLEPGRPRGENTEVAWMTEIVDWQHTSRKECFDNVTTACRIGRAQYFWDTTSKGKNDVIKFLLEQHRDDPHGNPLIRGTMFDNPMLGAKYLRSEWRKYTGRRREEEIEGKTFDEAEGASWKQEWLDKHRVLAARPYEQVVLAVDPALSAAPSADVTGLCAAGRDSRGHSYVIGDYSDHYTPDQWGALTVRKALELRAAGVIVERNHLGDNARFAIASAVRTKDEELRRGGDAHGLVLRDVPVSDVMPLHTPGVLYVKEVVAAESKLSRAAGPAAETEAGRVHMVGTHAELELELTTFEPGSRRSPNRLDALVYAVIETARLGVEETNPQGDLAAAKQAQDEIRTHVARISAKRRVGL